MREGGCFYEEEGVGKREEGLLGRHVSDITFPKKRRGGEEEGATFLHLKLSALHNTSLLCSLDTSWLPNIVYQKEGGGADRSFPRIKCVVL